MAELFTNLASTTLSGDHSAVATTITVADGAAFPSPTGSDFFRVLAFKKSTAQKEIMICTSRASNVLTVTRGEEGTTALALLSGDIIELRPTAAFFSGLAQKLDIQDGGTVYAATSGTSAYTATLSPVPVSIAAGYHASLKIGATNDATTCTLNLNTIGAVAIKKVSGGALVDLAVGDLVQDMIAEFRHNGTVWMLLNPPGDGGGGGGSALTAPSGTRMLFQQTAAPTGWTKDTAHNNKALRIVSGTAGSGGSVSFTAAFAASRTSDAHTLSLTQIPAHTHSGSGLTAASSGDHAHTYTVDVFPAGSGGLDGGGSQTTANTSTAGAHTHSISGSTGNAGGGGSHSHGLPSFAVQYVDIITAVKD
jgi:microcystin-dependent protein